MRTVLITGIGKGIGKALAEKFLIEGFNVIGTIRTGQTDIPGVLTYPLDLADPESIRTTTHALCVEHPTIDIVINNAGVLLDEEETSLNVDLLRRTLDVNLLGTVAFTEALKGHITQGGHIVNISSEAGSLTEANGTEGHYPHHYPAYKISKTALNMYTRTLAVELRGKAIVSSVHPGWVQTDMGGSEADMTPAEAAEGIFNTAIAQPETGQFWFKGEKLPW